MKVTNPESSHDVAAHSGGSHLPIASPEGIPGEEFLEDARKILASGQLTNGAQVRRLEEVAAAYLEVPYCVAVSSCTAGLLLTLRALELRGEVILPSFTFHATAHGLLWNGLKPVFADCDEQTFCIDPEAVREKLSPTTAAILAVHIFGCPAAVDELEQISSSHGIPLICDAAHAFGSKVGTRRIGTYGAAEVFSLSPTKVLVAGEGGLVATRDRVLAQGLRAARNYGDVGDGDPQVLGLNARMSEFHAALGLCGFSGLEARIDRRNQIRLQYLRGLEGIPGLRFQEVPKGSRSTFKDMAVLVDPIAFGASRDWLVAFLQERGIEARRYFWPPVHRQKLYHRVWDRRPLPITDRVSNGILDLPIYSGLRDEDVSRVCEALLDAHRLAQQIRDSARAGAQDTETPARRPFAPMAAPRQGRV